MSYLDQPDHLLPSDLHRLRSAAMLLACPGLASQFSPIPGSFWVDGDTAEVDCPCGEQPRLELGELRVCECERAFIKTRNDVLVAGGPEAARRALKRRLAA